MRPGWGWSRSRRAAAGRLRQTADRPRRGTGARERAARHLRRGALQRAPRQDRPRGDPLRHPRRGGRDRLPQGGAPRRRGRALLAGRRADRGDAARGDRPRRERAARWRGPHRRQARPQLARGAARGNRRRAAPGGRAPHPALRGPGAAPRRNAGGRGAARPARGAARPQRAAGARQPARFGAGGAQRRNGHRDREEGGHAGARPRRARARTALGLRADRPDGRGDRRLGHEGAERGDLLFVEGQGALFHPAYSGVTLGLLHGSAPDLLVLDHKAGAATLRNYPDLPIPPPPELVAAYEGMARRVRPAHVAAIALNTADLDSDEDAREAIAAAQAETSLVADDVVRFGPERVLDAVLAEL